MRRIHNQTTHDEETETNPKESTMKEPYTDETGTKTRTDGGTQEIRDSDEVQFSDDEIRYYSADGYLYAYREDDKPTSIEVIDRVLLEQEQAIDQMRERTGFAMVDIDTVNSR